MSSLIRNHANFDALHTRINNLQENGFNGIKMVIVDISSNHDIEESKLSVYFYNENIIQEILNDINSSSIFSILGGSKIIAGPASDQIKVTKVLPGNANNIIELIVSPIGDYSTYVLNVNHNQIDPLFSEIEFKFRPGCFTNECEPEYVLTNKKQDNVIDIDYLAKDFDSFRHAMIVAMMDRVPGWQPTSEADLDQVLIELLCASADELSDFQDRVTNESFLATAKKRISLARYAKIMDSPVKEGNQANTWLAFKLKPPSSEYDLKSPFTSSLFDFDWKKFFVIWTRNTNYDIDTNLNNIDTANVFIIKDDVHFDLLLNKLDIYTWENTITTLPIGSTSADLKFPNEESATKIKDLICSGKIKHLLIQQDLNSSTGEATGFDKTKRQLLHLLQCNNCKKEESSSKKDCGAEIKSDPITSQTILRVRWRDEDKLKTNYHIIMQKNDGSIIQNVSSFYGNLVQAYYGTPIMTDFKSNRFDIYNDNHNNELNKSSLIYNIETTALGSVCELPLSHLLYENTTDNSTKSTLKIEVSKINKDTNINLWPKIGEVISLIHSTSDDETFLLLKLRKIGEVLFVLEMILTENHFHYPKI